MEMKTTSNANERKGLNIGRASALTVLGAMGAITLFSPLVPAEAAPDYYSGPGRNQGNRNVTVYGVVTRDLRGNDRFTVRLDNGRNTEVISRVSEPIRLSRGDRVELRGDFERNLFIADYVRIIRNNGSGNGGWNNGGGWNNPQSVQRGVVTRDGSGRDFSLRLDNNRTITVRAQNGEPVRLTRGDYVEVRGYFSGNIFLARDVRILRNDDRRRVDFQATVIRRESYNRIIVRGDNRRTYTVTTNSSLDRFDRNDRVRVVGILNGDSVTAASVVLLRNR
jgi:translation initiation factor IF-1